MEKIELMRLIEQLHHEANILCRESFGSFLKNAGNIGVFSQSESDYKDFLDIQKKIVKLTDDPNQKYFELFDPITMKNPNTTYTHLYIRKPDPSPYGLFLGDIDFYVSENQYEGLLVKARNNQIPNAAIYIQKNIGELIQLTNRNFKTVAYISTKEITQEIRFKK